MLYVRRRFDSYAHKSEEFSDGLLSMDKALWDSPLLENKQKVLANAILGDYLQIKDLILSAYFQLEKATQTPKRWFAGLFPWTRVGRLKKRFHALMRRALRKVTALTCLATTLKLKDWTPKKPMSQQTIRSCLGAAIDVDTQFKEQVQMSTLTLNRI